MSDPLVTSDDLAIALNDPTINEERADFWIGQAQTLCESIVSPLPDAAVVVVTRVAARAYASTASGSRGGQYAAAGSPMAGGLGGGCWLSRADKSDLRRLAGGGNAFTIDLLPADYSLDLPIWNQAGNVPPVVETS